MSQFETMVRFPKHEEGECAPVEKTVRKPASEEEKEKIRKMFADGKKITEIAKETGYAQSSISRWCGTSIPKNTSSGRTLTRSEKDEMVELSKSGVSQYDLAEKYGIAQSTVNWHLSRYGLTSKRTTPAEPLNDGQNSKPKHDYHAELNNAHQSLMEAVEGIKKEPASAGTPTSSKIKNPTINDTSKAKDCQVELKIISDLLNLATDTINEIYKSDSYDNMPTTLSVGFGRAWAMIDVAYSLLVKKLNATEEQSNDRP